MNNTLDTYYCSRCGGANIEVKAWIDANTFQYCDDCAKLIDDEDTWCNDCIDYAGVATLKELWLRFSEVSINNDDEIQEPFLCFETGTSRFDIWRWFDERCPNGVIIDLIGQY